MEPVPEIDDLRWIFESDPESAFPGDDWRGSWPYSAITFTTVRSGATVRCYLEPANNTVGIVIDGDSPRHVRLDLDGIKAVTTERLHGNEELVVHFRGDRPRPALRLRLKPTVDITWGTGVAWPPGAAQSS